MEDEEKVIASVLSGDKDAFSEIVIKYQTTVYNLAFKMVRNEQDALDIAQETFLRIYSSLGSFKGGSRFSTWIYRITYNQAIDFIRRKSRAEAVSLADTAGTGEILSSIPDKSADPSTAVESKDLFKQVAEAILALPDQQRTALILREYEGLSYKEIAQRTGVLEGTVKSRIARARRGIYDFLVKNGTIGENDRLNKRKEVDSR